MELHVHTLTMRSVFLFSLGAENVHEVKRPCSIFSLLRKHSEHTVL